MKPSSMRKSSARRGFTLMETMYASAIFGIGLTGLIGLETNTALAAGRLQKLSTAEQLMLSQAELWRSQPTAKLQPQLSASQGGVTPTRPYEVSALKATTSTVQFDRLGRTAGDPNFSGAAYQIDATTKPGGGDWVQWLDTMLICSWRDSGNLKSSGPIHKMRLDVRVTLP